MSQKCDAKRPCTTCTIARTPAECVYDDERSISSADFHSSYDAEDYFSEESPVATPTRDGGFGYQLFLSELAR